MTPGEITVENIIPTLHADKTIQNYLLGVVNIYLVRTGEVRTNMHACVCVGVYGDLFRNEIVMRRNVSMYVWIRTLMGLKIRNSKFMKVYI